MSGLYIGITAGAPQGVPVRIGRQPQQETRVDAFARGILKATGEHTGQPLSQRGARQVEVSEQKPRTVGG